MSPVPLISLMALLAFAVDQATKWFVVHILMQPPSPIELLPFLTITLGYNRGVSFGMFADTFGDTPYAMALAQLAILAIAGAFVRRSRNSLELAGFGLIVGGALGNIADRLRRGAVTDFISLHAGDWRWPTFNGADIAITIGVVLFFLASVGPVASRGRVDAD